MTSPRIQTSLPRMSDLASTLLYLQQVGFCEGWLFLTYLHYPDALNLLPISCSRCGIAL